MILFDLDDFCDDLRSVNDMETLISVRRLVPTLKVTLFTIPGRCSRKFVEGVKVGYPWVDLVQHGWMHASNYECISWDEQTCRQRLHDARELGFTTKGFKAPGWKISDACYRVLQEEGYWVADQEYNDKRRPKGLPAYRLIESRPVRLEIFTKVDIDLAIGSVTQLHGHIGHLGGRNANALEYLLPEIMHVGRRDTNWKFISEVME